jgi:hypothetical protein
MRIDLNHLIINYDCIFKEKEDSKYKESRG